MLWVEPRVSVGPGRAWLAFPPQLPQLEMGWATNVFSSSAAAKGSHCLLCGPDACLGFLSSSPVHLSP